MTAILIPIHARPMSDEVIKAPKNKGGRPKGVKRSIKKLTQGELANVVLDFARGVDQRQIATKNGVSESAISLVLEKFKPAFAELHNVEEYRKAKGMILDSVALATLKGISNPAKLEDAPLNQLAYVFDVVGKHSRLEAGLSTQNVATQTQISVKLSNDYDEQ